MKGLTVSMAALLLVVSVAQVCSAGWGTRNVRGSDDVATEERKVRDIRGVDLATAGRLVIEIGDQEKLVIEAEDNLLEYIETNVHGGVLVIETRERINLRPRKPIRYYLTVKELSEIEISSSGDIEAPSLTADRFRIRIGSSGDLHMKDLNVSSLDIMVRSSGDVSLENVTAKKVEIDVQSSGDVTLRELRSQTLMVDISSSGDVEIGTGHVNEQDIIISSSGDYEAKGLESEEATVAINSSGNATVRVSEFLSARTGSSGNIYYIGDPELRRKTSSSGRIKQIK